MSTVRTSSLVGSFSPRLLFTLNSLRSCMFSIWDPFCCLWERISESARVLIPNRPEIVSISPRMPDISVLDRLMNTISSWFRETIGMPIEFIASGRVPIKLSTMAPLLIIQSMSFLSLLYRKIATIVLRPSPINGKPVESQLLRTVVK